MAASYPVEAGGVASPTRPRSRDTVTALHALAFTFNMTAQTTSDTLEGIKLPKGFRPHMLGLFASATLGLSTLAVGVAGTTGKYRAAATLTANALAPVLLGTDSVLAADEDVLVTIAAATMPGSGTVRIVFYGTFGPNG